MCLIWNWNVEVTLDGDKGGEEVFSAIDSSRIIRDASFLNGTLGIGALKSPPSALYYRLRLPTPLHVEAISELAKQLRLGRV